MKTDFRSAGLTASEYSAIRELLQREPNFAELRILGVMWSEHCSYKSTRRLLSLFPKDGEQVVQGPGENAGIVDAGDGWGIAFKVESHNHPSAVAPYQGAATGVGGIIRDILAMGARPAALMDGLCLGLKTSSRAAALADGIVKGIAGYGNAVGVPTIGGKTLYSECYNGNPLVNAMCLGTVKLDNIVSSRTALPGHLAVLIGSRTGRDGIAGAAFASSELSDDTRSSRPQVQIGDPFVEKLLIECCLEIHSKGLIVAMQDMGAAGITSSSSEIAAKSGTGIRIEADLVPLREKMEPWEIALSESQERMLLIAEPEHLDEIGSIAAKWQLECAAIGEVTDDGLFVMTSGGSTVVSLPAEMVGGGCPPVLWPSKRPSSETTLPDGGTGPLDSSVIRETLAAILRDPGISDKSAIYKQYDYMVQTGTVVPPGRSVSVFRVRQNGRLIGVTMEADPWKCSIDPFKGAAETFLKALRPLWLSGAAHLGMTNCLNYPSPENPENFWVLEESVKGLAAVAGDLSCPVVSGNVSLYNENPEGKIMPTPMVGVVGLFEKNLLPLEDQSASGREDIFLAGDLPGTLEGSLFARLTGNGVHEGRISYDPAKESSFMSRALETARGDLATCARPIAGGGLLTALSRICISSNMGLTLLLEPPEITPGLLFGEWGPRAVYLVPEGSINGFLETWDGFPVKKIGFTGGSSLSIGDREILPVKKMQKCWRGE